jgi:hypothetical protein
MWVVVQAWVLARMQMQKLVASLSLVQPFLAPSRLALPPLVLLGS